MASSVALVSRLSPEQQTAFFEASDRVLGRDRTAGGIGTLCEKTTHAILKYYYSPDASCHEIPVSGYIADIFTGSEIFEIQTSGFHLLRKKIEQYPDSIPVTVVCPVVHMKWLAWIDPVTGEEISNRRSPKIGQAQQCFKELYRIRAYLRRPNLSIRIALLDVQEYRLLDGWNRDRKRGSHRLERIPLQFYDEICLETPDDYRQLLPEALPEIFTAKEYSACAKISLSTAQTGLLLLFELGLVDRIGKRRNSYLYQVRENT